MTAISRAIDFHVVAVLLLLLALAAFLPHRLWLLIVLAIIPQGRILTRAFGDFPKQQRPAGAYLIANEALVALALLSCWTAWHFLGRV
ncbi:MAG: hypothetical protein HY735_20605 [Verrucomicrobia bacterium]|nr:hypothetical protein [Verrucomicrobiota bacterium]